MTGRPLPGRAGRCTHARRNCVPAPWPWPEPAVNPLARQLASHRQASVPDLAGYDIVLANIEVARIRRPCCASW